MKVRLDFWAGPFRVTGGPVATALIILGLLVLCCPWSSAWDALTK